MNFTKNIKFFLLLLIAMFCNNAGYAQQIPQFTQYYFNQLPLNPAYAGSVGNVVIEADVRAQWLGIEGAPLTQTIGVHLPVPLLRSGVGLHVNNDLVGAGRWTSAYFSYAYKQKISRSMTLSFGLQAGILQTGLKGDELITPEGEYGGGLVEHNDLLVPNATQAGLSADGGLGVYLAGNNFSVGLAAHRLLEPTLQIPVGDQTVEIQTKRNFLANVSYDFAIGNTIVLTPTLLFKSDLTQHQLDINTLFTINENILAGVGFRGFNQESFDAVMLMAGMHITKYLLIGYSYDLSLSPIRSVNTGSHEISIHYALKGVLPTGDGKTRYNPRFM